MRPGAVGCRRLLEHVDGRADRLAKREAFRLEGRKCSCRGGSVVGFDAGRRRINACRYFRRGASARPLSRGGQGGSVSHEHNRDEGVDGDEPRSDPEHDADLPHDRTASRADRYLGSAMRPNHTANDAKNTTSATRPSSPSSGATTTTTRLAAPRTTETHARNRPSPVRRWFAPRTGRAPRRIAEYGDASTSDGDQSRGPPGGGVTEHPSGRAKSFDPSQRVSGRVSPIPGGVARDRGFEPQGH